MAHWSREAQRLTGYVPSDVIGMPLADLFDADGSEFRHRDGRRLGIRPRFHPLLDAEGRETFLVTMDSATEVDAPVDDVLMEWLFDQQSMALAVYDCDARVLRTNEAMRVVAGFPEIEVRGLRTTEFLEGPAYEETERRMLRTSASSGVTNSRRSWSVFDGAICSRGTTSPVLGSL
ncbi:PAS domain-containing protein [Streptomyces sp. NPDC032161]|uniref:PAS domain-containing protein n=1 Tax=unclassified Streptomyces TaxID=2593676 RepID=UPI0033E7078E